MICKPVMVTVLSQLATICCSRRLAGPSFRSATWWPSSSRLPLWPTSHSLLEASSPVRTNSVRCVTPAWRGGGGGGTLLQHICPVWESVSSIFMTIRQVLESKVSLFIAIQHTAAEALISTKNCTQLHPPTIAFLNIGIFQLLITAQFVSIWLPDKIIRGLIPVPVSCKMCKLGRQAAWSHYQKTGEDKQTLGSKAKLVPSCQLPCISFLVRSALRF